MAAKVNFPCRRSAHLLQDTGNCSRQLRQAAMEAALSGQCRIALTGCGAESSPSFWLGRRRVAGQILPWGCLACGATDGTSLSGRTSGWQAETGSQPPFGHCFAMGLYGHCVAVGMGIAEEGSAEHPGDGGLGGRGR